jgi:hypothetical protein
MGADIKALEARLQSAAAGLAGQAHLHIIEQAQEKLHSRREMYLEALVQPQEVSKNVWVISLDAKANWIEDGLSPFAMQDTLLKGPGVKTGKNGNKYRVIPFSHSGGPSGKTQPQNSLTDTLKSEFKQRKIPWSKMEKDEQGNTKTGLIHKFDVKDKPLRPEHSAGKPGWGKGKVGEVMQGPAETGSTPLLQGVRVYQKQMFGKDGSPMKNSKGNLKFSKQIMTFRVISSKNRNTWNHPGLEGMKFFTEAAKWVSDEWANKVLPEIMDSLNLGGTPGS